MTLARDELVARLTRAGELAVSGEDQAETDSYFDTDRFRFHGPDGFEADYGGLTDYFKAIRATFDERSIRRWIVIVEGDHVAYRSVSAFSVAFTRCVGQSPARYARAGG